MNLAIMGLRLKWYIIGGHCEIFKHWNAVFFIVQAAKNTADTMWKKFVILKVRGESTCRPCCLLEMKSLSILPKTFFGGSCSSKPAFFSIRSSPAKSLYRLVIFQLVSGIGPNWTLTEYSCSKEMKTNCIVFSLFWKQTLLTEPSKWSNECK